MQLSLLNFGNRGPGFGNERRLCPTSQSNFFMIFAHKRAYDRDDEDSVPDIIVEFGESDMIIDNDLHNSVTIDF